MPCVYLPGPAPAVTVANTGYWTDRMPDSLVFRHLYIRKCTGTGTCMDTDKRYGHGHASWTWGWKSTMDAGMPIKCLVWHRQFSVSLQYLGRHRHSGIVVSPVLLVTDQSVNAQLYLDMCCPFGRKIRCFILHCVSSFGNVEGSASYISECNAERIIGELSEVIVMQN